MEQKTNKSKLKIIIPIAIVILAVVGIVAFTSNKGTPKETKAEELSKEQMLQVAENKTGEYFQELGENKVAAEMQINKIFKISGVTYNIENNNVEIVVGDDTICKMYLPKEELVTLKKNQDITVVGKLSNFNTKDLLLTKLAYFEFKNCYIVELGKVH